MTIDATSLPIEPASDDAPADKRLTGADTTISFFKGDVLQDGINLIKTCVVTFRDDNRANLEISAHQDSAALIDFIENAKDGEISIGVMMAFPNGQARAVMFSAITFGLTQILINARHDRVETRFVAIAGSYKVLR